MKISMLTHLKITLTTICVVLLVGSIHQNSITTENMLLNHQKQKADLLMDVSKAVIRDDLLRGNMYLVSSKLKQLLKKDTYNNFVVEVVDSFGNHIFATQRFNNSIL